MGRRSGSGWGGGRTGAGTVEAWVGSRRDLQRALPCEATVPEYAILQHFRVVELALAGVACSLYVPEASHVGGIRHLWISAHDHQHYLLRVSGPDQHALDDDTWDWTSPLSLGRLLSVLEGRDADVGAEAVANTVQSVIIQLERTENRLLGTPFITEGKHGGHRFRLCYLLQIFLLSCNLKADSLVRDTVLSVLSTLFGEHEVKTMADAVRCNQIKMPSASTLSQFKFVVDTAFLLCCRSLFAKTFAHASSASAYIKSDSSPQGTTNWLNSEMWYVPADCVLKLARAWKELVRLQPARHDDEATWDKEGDLLTDILDGLHHHHFLPVGLGSGRADVVHEMHAFFGRSYLRRQAT